MARPKHKLARAIPWKAVASMAVFLSGCEAAPVGMDVLYDPAPIVGCYKSSSFPSDVLRITEQKILLNDAVLYSRYEYGLDGRAKSPLVYAYPRVALQDIDGQLASAPYRGGDGGFTLLRQQLAGQDGFVLPVFPGPKLSTFLAIPCTEPRDSVRQVNLVDPNH